MSSEPRASLHVIVFMGLAAIGIVLLMMMTSMEGLQQSQAGMRAKIANAVIGEYKFEDAFAEFKREERFMVFHLNYRTREYLKPDARDAQMKDVARFVYQESQKFEDPELYDTLRVDITRTEMTGSGCFERKTDYRTSLDLPKRLPVQGGTRIGPPVPATTGRPPGAPKDN
jgi:hypothetical protein